MVAIDAILDQAGWAEAPVLIQGETGSGKEVIARELHARSRRAKRPFFKLNCAALPSELVESELFGYERGAFTGAFQRKAGIFEAADSGTILLDEIGDMDVRLQAKLLQVLQDQQFRRVGGNETIRANVRVLAATHRDLETQIAEGKFREDLYYRLNVIKLIVPPLRERKDDLFAIAELLLKKHALAESSIPEITPELRAAMLAWHWPGNVRELENFVRKLLIFQDSSLLTRELNERMARRQLSLAAPSVGEGLKACAKIEAQNSRDVSILEEVSNAQRRAEIDAIMAALAVTRWNRKQAAALLNVDYKALLYKMKKLGVDQQPPNVAEDSMSGTWKPATQAAS
jgi:two-component system response regulator AtoC